jgi:hypothetical protein
MSDTELNNTIIEEEDTFDDEIDEEAETIDLTENPLYQVLTAFFEDDNGNNLCDILLSIKGAIDNNTRAIMNMSEKVSELVLDDEEDEA